MVYIGAMGLYAARNAIVVIIASSMAAVLYHNDLNTFSLTGNITSGIPQFSPPSFTLTHGNHTYGVQDFFEVSKSAVFAGTGSDFVIPIGLDFVEIFNRRDLFFRCYATAVSSPK